MKGRVALFLIASVLAGFGAVLGSVAGHTFGPRGLMVGGLLGGLLGATASAFVARRFGWVRDERFRQTALGACTGFLAAAAVATHTLGSPVGPVLSTLLIGLGAALGAGRLHDHVA